MSSMDELYNRVQEKVKTAKTQLEKTVNPTKKTVSKYSDTVSDLYRQAAESMKGSAAQQETAVDRQMQSEYGTADIDRLIGEYQVAEAMANMGLSDSGKNQTALEALQTQAHVQSDVIQEKSKQLKDRIREQLTEYLEKIRQKEIQELTEAAFKASSLSGKTPKNK